MADFELLYKMVMEFFLQLRSNNRFDAPLYNEIYQQLSVLVEEWKTQNSIPKLAFVTCAYLVDTLAAGSRFLSNEDCIKVEDASIAINELIASLDDQPPYPE